jgi:hypothetical protein
MLSTQMVLSGVTVVAQTSPVATSGWYYISAFALMGIDINAAGSFCNDYLVIAGTYGPSAGGNFVGGYTTASFTDALFINAGDSIQMLCFPVQDIGSNVVIDGGLTAILINSGFDAKQARHSRARHPPVTPGAVK